MSYVRNAPIVIVCLLRCLRLLEYVLPRPEGITESKLNALYVIRLGRAMKSATIDGTATFLMCSMPQDGPHI